MDHDSAPFGVPGPASPRVDDVRRAYAELSRRGLAGMGERVDTDPVYRSNAHGHLAWDLSLSMRAACLAWRVSRQRTFLEQAVSWARYVVENTDAAAGRADWRGRSGPVWSAGSRYTAGAAVVGSVAGAPIRLQAAADRVVVERPSSTTAIVRAVCDDGRAWASPEASLLPGEANYLPDLLARRSTVYSVLLRDLPGPARLTSIAAGEYVLERQFAPYLVHTAMIARGLLAVAAELEALDPGAIRSDASSDDLYSAAERALRAHDDEMRTRSGHVWYVTPEDFPGRRLGLELPHNHVADAATSFLLLGRRRRSDGGLTDLGVSLASRFLREIAAYEAGTLPHPWYYYPVDSDTFSGVSREQPLAERLVPPVKRAEDSSHATLRVRALAEWKAIDDDLVADQTMSAVALSFRRFFMTGNRGVATLRWLPGDDSDAPRRGLSDTYAGAWGALAPWDSTIQRRINSMAYRHPPTAIFGATVLSATEILAMNCARSTYASSGRNARG